jgi:soluble lytic murein transglycosylase-like protein
MAINQIDTTAPIFNRKLEVPSDTDKGQTRVFEDLLGTAIDSSSTSSGNTVDPKTTAEILRLQMLRSAISPSETDTARPLPTVDALTKAIAIFKEQESPSGTASVADGAVKSPEPANPAATKAASPDLPLADIITRASKRYNVDAGLIKAVIKAESNFNPRAVSHAGAQGLMQLMPATARGLGVTDSFDAEQNVMAGTRFLKDMLKRYGGDVDSALAAYHWGPGNVDRHGDTLPRETREYLVKVKKYYQDFTA